MQDAVFTPNLPGSGREDDLSRPVLYLRAQDIFSRLLFNPRKTLTLHRELYILM
jgi:hypothetical protein